MGSATVVATTRTTAMVADRRQPSNTTGDTPRDPTCRDQPITEQRGCHSRDDDAHHQKWHGQRNGSAEVVQRCKRGEHFGRVDADS